MQAVYCRLGFARKALLVLSPSRNTKTHTDLLCELSIFMCRHAGYTLKVSLREAATTLLAV